jgi:hypothetical protein
MTLRLSALHFFVFVATRIAEQSDFLHEVEGAGCMVSRFNRSLAGEPGSAADTGTATAGDSRTAG